VATDAPIIGRTVSGSLVRGGDRIVLVATEFRGEFTYSKAENAFLAAKSTLVRQNKTVSTGRYDRRLASDRHVVYGWFNIDREEYGFVAFKINSNGRSALTVDNEGNTKSINDWDYQSWDTNGFTVTIQIADDDRGGVAAIFHPIR
jgi:hypothetical protein